MSTRRPTTHERKELKEVPLIDEVVDEAGDIDADVRAQLHLSGDSAGDWVGDDPHPLKFR